MAIPETEADIELTGLKVDDLVNSIRARSFFWMRAVTALYLLADLLCSGRTDR
jgi:hypothetical protein